MCQALFSSATTYAEAHQQWHEQGPGDGPEAGLLGVGEDGALYRSFDGFSAWELMAQLEAPEAPGGLKVEAMTRTASGRYYLVSRGRLYAMDSGAGGALRPLATLTCDGAAVRGPVLAMCASQWLHQKHQEQVFVVLPHGPSVGLVPTVRPLPPYGWQSTAGA